MQAFLKNNFVKLRGLNRWRVEWVDIGNFSESGTVETIRHYLRKFLVNPYSDMGRLF